MFTDSRVALALALSAALPAVTWAQDAASPIAEDANAAAGGNDAALPAADPLAAGADASTAAAPEAAPDAAAAEPQPYDSTVQVANEPPPPVAEEESAAGHNRLTAEVIVTAQKREENMQKVPISITAFSADALDAKGISDPKALAQATPGMYYGQTVNFAVIYIRGVGSDAFLPDSDPSIATYIDGIYYPFANGLSQAFGAVERVEVLKGPQGTLFGRNSTGGAINTVTKSPDQNFETSLLASYESYNDMKLRGYINIPLTDTLAASLSVVHNQSDSYYDGTINNPATPLLGLGGSPDAASARGLPDTTENAARLKAKWDILDNLDFNVAGFIDLTQGLSSSAMPNVNPSLLQKTLDTVYGVQTVQPGTYRVDVDVPGYFRSNNKVVYGQLNYRPDWFDVKLLGSHQKIVADNYFDFDGTRVPFIEFGAPGQFADVTTSELQLVSKKDGILPEWLDGIVGLYYFKEKSGFPDNRLSVLGGISNGQLAGLPLPSALTSLLTDGGPLSNLVDTLTEGLGLPNAGIPNGVDVSLHDQLGTKSWAAYTQETVHFTDSLSFTAGVRYQQEERTVIQSDVLLINTDGSESPLLSFNTPSKKSHNTSPKFVLNYNFTDDIMTYASWTKGYKSGTFKTVNVYTQPQYVKPETVTTTELGFKSTFMNGALRFNAAAFENKINDMQVQFISVLGGGVAQLENAKGARIRGAEFDTQWTPLVKLDPGLVVTGGITYLDGVFTDYPKGSGYDETTGIFFGKLPGGIDTGRDFTGNQITRTPKWSASFGLNQLIENVGDGNLELAADYYYNSGFYYLAQNSPTSKQDAYYVLNASISYLYDPWKFRVTAFGKNLTDQTYTYSKFILDTGTLEYLAPPRTFGIRLGLDF